MCIYSDLQTSGRGIAIIGAACPRLWQLGMPVWLTLSATGRTLKVLATFDDQAASRKRRLSRSRLARLYIWRLIIFSRLIWPSTGPVPQGSVTAARTAS